MSIINVNTIPNPSPSPNIIVLSKGTGAGGANTNLYGKKFEEKTNNQNRLIRLGFVKNVFMKKYSYLISSEILNDNSHIIFIL